MLCRRVTVSVPGELRESMRRMRNVNWSQIAQDAFRRAIEERTTWNTRKRKRGTEKQLRAFLNKLVAAVRIASEEFGLTGIPEET